ncbi:hypothetical protein [Bordetella sp. LUAb4]|uniref:bestrophin-like domain n=1 Tax=Bordetella sp. LUAb4 TaxID=2843195 RepID=UPI001E39A211|nr:hypothetical protein [Bordetella sp. LUAb4]
MSYSLLLGSVAAAFFVCLLVAMQIGRRIGQHRRAGKHTAQAGAGAIEAAVFALLGLLIAFTFSGAAQRLVERRNLIVQEVNAIGTAWLRIGLLDAPDQARMRNLFRDYVDSRLDYFHNIGDLTGRDAIAARSATLQNDIWNTAMMKRKNIDPEFMSSFVQAMNDMFDALTTVTVAQNAHPPPAIYILLGVLALLCACIVGLNLSSDGGRGWFHQALYALVMTATLYVIVDLEFPRVGYIRLDQIDSLLESQRASMGAAEPAP